MSDKLYQEELMEHYRYPQNIKPLTNPHFSATESNPSCGDSMYIEGYINDNAISNLCFKGSGCVISQATASMLTQKCIGSSLIMVRSLSQSDIVELIGIELGPVRLKCALLSLHVLQRGISQIIDVDNNVKQIISCKGESL